MWSPCEGLMVLAWILFPCTNVGCYSRVPSAFPLAHTCSTNARAARFFSFTGERTLISWRPGPRGPRFTRGCSAPGSPTRCGRSCRSCSTWGPGPRPGSPSRCARSRRSCSTWGRGGGPWGAWRPGSPAPGSRARCGRRCRSCLCGGKIGSSWSVIGGRGTYWCSKLLPHEG